MYSETRNRKLYPTFVSVSPMQYPLFAETILKTMKHFGWSKLAVIADSSNMPSFIAMPVSLQRQIDESSADIHVQIRQFRSLDPGVSFPELLTFASAHSKGTVPTRFIGSNPCTLYRTSGLSTRCVVSMATSPENDGCLTFRSEEYF